MKKIAKRALALLLLLIIILGATEPVHGQVHRGQRTFGPHVGYVSRNASADAGLSFTYAFSSHVRIAPDAFVIFRHHNLDGIGADINMQFPLGSSSRCAFYPLAGVNFTSWGRHSWSDAEEGGKDVSSHTNLLGLNAGAGFEVNCTSALRLSVEARYTLVRHLPSAFASVGIAYVF